MGFVVDADRLLVTVDHSHNNFCVTTPAGNPAVTYHDGLKITSVFTRTKGKRGPVGDNCPMLYALKGLHSLTTRSRDIGMLHASFRQILPAFLASGFEWDWIVPLPSSSLVCSTFARKVHQRTGIGIVQADALMKITADQAMRNVEGLRIQSKDKTVLKGDIRRFIRDYGAAAPFQIKYAKAHLRHHIHPFMWGHVPAGTAPARRVLLVDDMVTSGTSLLSAAEVIRHRYPTVDIEALTLFGSSR